MITKQFTGRVINQHQKALWILCFVLMAVLCGCAAKQQTSAGTGWIDLFNGKDLDDWIIKISGYELNDNPGNTFRVEDGILKVSYDQFQKFDGEFGHMFYKDKFSHYILRLEYRVVGTQLTGGPEWGFRNSGIMLHSQPPETIGKDQDFPVSVEVQLLSGDGTHDRTTANVCTPGTNVVIDGDLITDHCVSSSSKTYHGEQWVKIEAEVHGNGIIKHFVNGQLVMEYQNPQLDETDLDAQKLLKTRDKMLSDGYIGLQAESHPLEFRKIQLLPLEE